MPVIIIVFALIVLLDSKQLKSSKTKARLLSTYLSVLAVNLIISFLLATGRRPVSPSEIIESVLLWMGVSVNG